MIFLMLMISARIGRLGVVRERERGREGGREKDYF